MTDDQPNTEALAVLNRALAQREHDHQTYRSRLVNDMRGERAAERAFQAAQERRAKTQRNMVTTTAAIVSLKKAITDLGG